MNPINASIVQKLTYDSVTNITQSPLIIAIFIGIWLFPIIIYLITAGCIRVRTSSGTKLKGSLLSKPTGWIAPIIWFFIQGTLIAIFLIFPIWLGKGVN